GPWSFPRAVSFLLHFPYPLIAEALTAPRPRTVGVTHHRVLWSPDFPLPGPSRRRGAAAFQAATVRPTCEPFHCTRAPASVLDKTARPGEDNKRTRRKEREGGRQVPMAIHTLDWQQPP